ncbi:MAG: metallophosphoesterase [Bacteroidetes bacterium]|nr:MAG: metallophosphoesterase [Bacteroidota bacterium]
MEWKNLISYCLVGAIALGAVGCKDNKNLESKVKETTPIVRTINGEEYRFEGNKVSQLSSDEDNEARYGVISDAHGEVEKARAFAQKFKELGVDGIILPGDLSNNETLRYGQRDSKPDKEEIKEVLGAVAETGLPVFVIPGNHERKPDYESALAEVTAKYDNVIDMTQFRVFDGDDADFVSLPGYQTFRIPGRQFIPDDGYWTKPDFIKKTGKLREGLDDVVVLITHGAGKTKTDGKLGPATIYSGKDVGDKKTTEMMQQNNIPFAIVGHIHEAGGIATTYDGRLIKQGEWAEQFTANFGTLERWRHLNGQTYNGMAGVLTVKGNQAKFNMMYLK